MNRKPWIRSLLKSCILVLLVVGVARQTIHFAKTIPFDDFLAYWSAARLQLDGQNPYSLEQLQTVQRKAGFSADLPYMMWYPPWVFPVILPFGFLSYTVARAFWLLAHVFLLVLCSTILWRFWGGGQKYVWVAWVLAFTFAPSTFVLRNGQMALVLLTGMVGFLYFEKAKNDWVAGASLYLLAIKPHLAFLFWIVLGLWVVGQKRWRILISTILSVAAAAILPLLFNFSVIVQSLNVKSNLPPFDWVTPTLGTVLRMLFGPENAFLQWLPSIVVSIGVLFYWWVKKSNWMWADELPLLIALGLFTSVYSWASDLVLLLPLLLKISVELGRILGIEPILYLIVYFVLNCTAFAMNLHGVNGVYYAWVSPAFLFGYLIIHKQSAAEVTSGKRTEIQG